MTSLALILSVLQDSVQAALDISEEKLYEIFRLFKSLLPVLLQGIYAIFNCESCVTGFKKQKSRTFKCGTSVSPLRCWL
jgi:hypothetical protein